MNELNKACPHCNGKLYIKHTWTKVTLSCRSCGRKLPQENYKDLMDEYLEEQLANVPINRL